MRGGWRYGAGRPGWKVKTESLIKLDIRYLKARNYLTPGYSYRLQWGYGHGNLAALNVTMGQSLQYKWINNHHHEAANLIDGEIFFNHTKCHYGGFRQWFNCPHCGRRVAVLYFVRGKWYCRQSLKVSYTSQCESKIDRQWRIKRKVEALLGEDLVRPKGMHGRTYDKLTRRWFNAEERIDEELLASPHFLYGT